jgi:hypothetical protein
MKTYKGIILILLSSLSVQVTYANTINNNKQPIEIKGIISDEAKSKERADTLLLRLNEIKSIDKSHLNRSEKKSLRKEVNTINKELVKTNGGIYLSVGAVLLVILLLIILL